MPYRALPVDIFLCIFRYLDIADLLKFRQVCRPFDELSRLKSAWHILLRTQLLERDIPYPAVNLDALRSRELERLVRRAVLVRRNWLSDNPRTTRQSGIQTSDITRNPAQQRTLRELKLFHHKTHPYLLCATVSVSPQKAPLLVIECWDVRRAPFCIARKHGPWQGGVLFNADASFPPSVAIMGPDDVQVLSLFKVAQSFNSTFTPVARIPTSIGDLVAFSGRLIVARDAGRLFVYDVNKGRHRMELLSPSLPPLNFPQAGGQQSDDCYETIVTEEYLVLLRTRYIAFYALRSFRQGPATMHGTARPAVYHVWQWPIDDGRIAHRKSHHAGVEPPLNIVVRFASTFPWPTNMLNRYVLQANQDYLPHLAVSPDNVPYDLGPVHIQTLSAPLRLFARTDLILGEYGTALWIDSHTEAYFGGAANGQRLAGRGVGAGDIASSSANASVYNVHETDGWHRLALDERYSRIAIGSQDGRVTVLDYA